MVSYDLTGKVALVTGAGSPAGLEIIKMISRAGAYVIAHDEQEEHAKDAVVQILEDGGAGEFFCTNPSNIDRFVDDISAAFGISSRIDILVNNTGAPDYSLLEDTSEETYCSIVNSHLKATFFATQATLPFMKRSGSGKIVNLTSTMGMVGCERGSAYCAVKAGLLGLTRAWALEFAPWRINVNSIAILERSDDFIRSDGPTKREARLRSVAGTTLFLASSASNFLTGQMISPNGGDIIVGA